MFINIISGYVHTYLYWLINQHLLNFSRAAIERKQKCIYYLRLANHMQTEQQQLINFNKLATDTKIQPSNVAVAVA